MATKIRKHRPSWHAAARTAIRRAQDSTDEARERKRFYSSKAWRQCRVAFIRHERQRRLVEIAKLEIGSGRTCGAEQLPCSECLRAGRFTPTNIIDHIVDRLIRPDLAFEWSNFDPKCATHHNQKTRRTMNSKG